MTSRPADAEPGLPIQPIAYDSPIAKLLAHGRTRDEAIARMRIALDEIVIGGVDTSVRCAPRVSDASPGRLARQSLTRRARVSGTGGGGEHRLEACTCGGMMGASVRTNGTVPSNTDSAPARNRFGARRKGSRSRTGRRQIIHRRRDALIAPSCGRPPAAAFHVDRHSANGRAARSSKQITAG
ncbi:hypothetical protein QZM52_21015 [Burkholderia metallica]|uniref:Biotin carboxylase C-terminal domain-containing protein n=1 Tax=Burkholderia metallica TaxID=488729 RepID=A0ABT8PFW5_9BURK|nr:hypothetical protein [Burkholderia metallica]MDN7933771.1 hypothetical protein [Burkholderia metallica]